MPKTIDQPPRRSGRLAAISRAPPPRSVQKRPTKRGATRKPPTGEAKSGDTNPTEDQMEIDDPPPGETDPAKIGRPISGLIHRNLTSAWQITEGMPMCFIFDSISPARIFKRGMFFSEDADFPDYDDSESGNVTETDVNPGLMPYLHDKYKQKYNFECRLRFPMFMSWMEGELRKFRFGQWRKQRSKSREIIVFTEYHIPAPYDRIISQLILELAHSNDHDSHESCRRANYAAKTLDAFGDELKGAAKHLTQVTINDVNGYAFPAAFRSKVLTPILQRQRVGIHDAYTPFVCRGIKRGAPPLQLSIEDVTRFYLSADPADPIHIHSYRRNILYNPDARWHLGTLMKNGFDNTQNAIEYYDKVRDNHDKIIAHLAGGSHTEVDSRGVFLLNETEIEVIIDEGIQGFFEEELNAVPDRVANVMKALATTPGGN